MRADLRSARAVCAGLAVLLAAGCAAMPADGPPERVEIPQGSGAENLQVRVFPVPPHKGEQPQDLLAGFLAASNADEAKDYETALKYLTAAAGKRWNPQAGVAVLTATPHRDQTVASAETTTITVSGSKVAELDDDHSYRVVSDDGYRQQFTFVKEAEGPDKGEWRIDRLPDGLIVDQTNFRNSYRAVHRYFYVSSDPSADGASPPVMVPDPIFLRRRTDPLTAAAKALASGPSPWLAPAVYSAFAGVHIQGAVTVNDSRAAEVRVDVADFGGRQSTCKQMATQLFHTLADQQGKAQLDRVDLSGAKGGCSVSAAEAADSAPGRLAGSAGAAQYYQLDTGQLLLLQGDGPGKPVAGPLGQAAQPKIGEVAVRRDGSGAAAIGADGHSLYVTGFGEGDKLGDPVVTSRAPQSGQGLASPSWDGRQNLWVVDRDPAASQVYMVRDRKAVAAQVDGLADRTVQDARISSDGTRIALVLKDGSGRRSLQIGLVVHDGTADAPRVRVSGLRPVAPLLTDVASVSWADTDQLLVLGKEQGKLQLLNYVGTDGSQSVDSPLQGGESMTTVSSSESRAGESVPPVLAYSSDHRIFRLQGNQWREIALQGHPAASFGYPG
ncbi:LpqB family beta-propeller domain-containing protein [Kitasatospora sp. NPDC085879]|uniref:LpqB family beta-propeller domain-containing protein n=1 Tax=Kitasatospora sp. NPDC085879 TaxID=3154769 RepID=UPI003442C476